MEASKFVKDTAVMLYVGAKHLKILDKRPEQLLNDMVYAAVTGKQITYYSSKTLEFYTLKELITKGFETIFKNIEKYLYVDGKLNPNAFELFEATSDVSEILQVLVMDTNPDEWSKVTASDVYAAFSKYNVARLTDVKTFEHWKANYMQNQLILKAKSDFEKTKFDK